MTQKPLIAALACTAFVIQIAPGLAQGRHAMMKPPVAHKMTMTTVSGQDRAFAKSVAEINAAEIMLGQLAQRKGGSWAKAFGGDMIRDHKMADAELRQTAMKNRVKLPKDPNAKQKAEYARLSRLSGAAFNNAYRTAQVNGHREAAAIVAREARFGTNSMFKNMAITLLPTINMHLKMAQQKQTMTGGSMKHGK